MNQTTIQHVMTCSGIGLHSGNQVRVTLRPAPANMGIVFEIHTADGIRRVSPTPRAVLTTELATTLGTNGASVSTVEHLLATILGLGIDNLIISVEGGEIPIMDGSASAFVELFARAGIRTLSSSRKVMRVNRTMEYRSGAKSIVARPHNGFRVSYTIDFPHPAIGRQHISMDVTPATFGRVANARTFGFYKDVEYLHSHGLARGGSLSSVIVLDDKGVMNPEGLRYRDEFVRHKLLDFIGDMAMLGTPIQGDFDVRCSGHQLNNEFLRKLEGEHVLSLVDTADEQHRKRLVPTYEGSFVLA